MILFAVLTLSYTDTRTIGWPFLITIPAVSAASAVAYDRFVCLSTWSKNRPTSGRLLCESTSCTICRAGSLTTRGAIRCSSWSVSLGSLATAARFQESCAHERKKSDTSSFRGQFQAYEACPRAAHKTGTYRSLRSTFEGETAFRKPTRRKWQAG